MDGSTPDLFGDAPASVEALGEVDPCSYDAVILMFSGGKDSVAAVLHLLELGVERDRIELWHHDVDGREGSSLMDWPVTADYCRAFARAFGLRIYFSWREGGIEREMLRDQALTAPVHFETPEGVRVAGGQRGAASTRLRFPQVSPNLAVRWCSAAAKIDVGSLALNNQDRFLHSRTLVVTGERAEESTSRARYAPFERHRCDRRDGRLKRHVDHWRPVHAWSEEEVWDILRRHRVRPHPAYELGWGRCSCLRCIFSSRDQWASSRAVDPEGFARVAAYEQQFGVTINRSRDVVTLADLGTPYAGITGPLQRLAMSHSYDAPILVDDWASPAGAFGESIGPT